MSDLVNHPEHYRSQGGLEAINVIESFSLNFHLGNAVKYILRAGKKDNEIQDLRKAMWYLKRQLNTLEQLYGKEIHSRSDQEARCFASYPPCQEG
jgi:Tfp pilus assembly protein PilF